MSSERQIEDILAGRMINPYPELSTSFDNLCRFAYGTFGVDAQERMLTEEQGELNQANSKWHRRIGSKVQIAEEIADNMLVLEQQKRWLMVEKEVEVALELKRRKLEMRLNMMSSGGNLAVRHEKLLILSRQMAAHHPDTEAHMRRVGNLSGKLWEETFQTDGFMAQQCGYWHDIGKLDIDVETLDKTFVKARIPFDNHDMEKMYKHPENGYKRIFDIHPVAALVALTHHTWQSESYPVGLEVGMLPHIIDYSHIVSIADKADAFMTRTRPEDVKPTREQVALHLTKGMLTTDMRSAIYKVITNEVEIWPEERGA